MNLVRGEVVWRLHATHGFPLEVSIPLLADRGYCPTWLDLIAAAETDGAKRGPLLRRLDPIIGDSYDAETAAAIRARLQHHHPRLEEA